MGERPRKALFPLAGVESPYIGAGGLVQWKGAGQKGMDLGGENGGFGSECQKCCERHRGLQFDGSPCRIEPAELRPSEPTSAACRLNSKSSFILRQSQAGQTDRWILASRRMTLLGLCRRVLLHAGGASFSRKHALVQCTGLLNETSLVTVGGRLRESYDFAHLISRERYARRMARSEYHASLGGSSGRPVSSRKLGREPVRRIG